MKTQTLETDLIESIKRDLILIKGYAGAGILGNEIAKQGKLKQVIYECNKSLEKINLIIEEAIQKAESEG